MENFCEGTENFWAYRILNIGALSIEVSPNYNINRHAQYSAPRQFSNSDKGGIESTHFSVFVFPWIAWKHRKGISMDHKRIAFKHGYMKRRSGSRERVLMY